MIANYTIRGLFVWMDDEMFVGVELWVNDEVRGRGGRVRKRERG